LAGLIILKKERRNNMGKKKKSKQEVEKELDEVGTTVVEADISTDDDDVPLEVEIMFMAFENAKKNFLNASFPPDIQFDIEGVVAELEDSFRELVRLVRGYVITKEEDAIEEGDRHDPDCACDDCIRELVEKEAAPAV
jgi:hypothetical protein